MKVLLCQSPLGQNCGQPLVFPLGLSYIASVLKENHDVTCWDPNISQVPLKELPALLSEVNPEIVGVSLRNIDSAFSFNIVSYYDQFVVLIRAIKKLAPNCKLIVGGAGFSLFAKEIMRRNPEIDFGVVSEGEYSFSELLENLDHPERIKNLIVRKKDQLVYTGKREWSTLDNLPFPSRELFDLDKYRGTFAMGIQAKRGCNADCIFCPNRIIAGDFCRLRSPKRVVDEIESIINNFGFDSFYFTDPLFNFPFDHSREIFKEAKRRKVDFKWQADFSPKLINSSYMRDAVNSGCDLFSFSPDGASNESLRFLGKDYDVKAVEKTIDLAKDHGANVCYSFLHDLPRYNFENIRGLMSLVPKMMMSLRSQLIFFSITKIRIYPYTLIHNIALEENKINEKTDLLHPVHYQSDVSVNLGDYVASFLRGFTTLFGLVCQKIRSN